MNEFVDIGRISYIELNCHEKGSKVYHFVLHLQHLINEDSTVVIFTDTNACTLI